MKCSSVEYLTATQVRERLAKGGELVLYRETRNTYAGWDIDSEPVHGSTVNALERLGEIKQAPGRSGGLIARVMVKS